MENERGDLSGQGGPAVTVRYRFWREARFDVMDHQIGLDGVFVRTPEPFAPGTEVEFEVSSSRIAGRLRGRAFVASVRERHQATPEEPPGMRIRFIGFEDPAAARATRARFRAASEARRSPEPEAPGAPPIRRSVAPDEQLDRDEGDAPGDRGAAASGRGESDLRRMADPPLVRDERAEEEDDPFFADRRRRLRRAVSGVLVAAAALVIAAVAGSLMAAPAPGRPAPSPRAEAQAPVRSSSASAAMGAGIGGATAPAAPVARETRAPAVVTAPPAAVSLPAAAPSPADAPANVARGSARTNESSKTRGSSRSRPRPGPAADIYE